MLYIIATPIGNLDDISRRAINTLKECEIILCEDTRVTKRLLERYEIGRKILISYHQHTAEGKVDKILDLILKHKTALVTDAGTPGISDPGNKIIERLLEKYGQDRVVISPIPGPSAVTAALSISGFPTDKFLFLGFVPHKKGRQKFFRQVIESRYTVAFYESCHRIVKTLEQLKEMPGAQAKRAVVARELTKKFETIYRGGLAEVCSAVKSDPLKGEYVVVIN
jgi:16S rRNA (cytidine1402-2'-O)-methyltransferase